MEKLLQGKNVLVTGAGQNIGRHIALEMAAQGANLYLAEKDEASCNRVQAELEARGTQCAGFVLDVSQPGEIDELTRRLREHSVSIDVLVNNVGRHTGPEEFGSPDMERWHRVWNTNVLGPMYLTQHLAKSMMERGQGGSILFITSIHQWDYRNDVNYSGSKAALGMMLQELAVDLAPHDIRVNGIAPGFVKEPENGRLRKHRFAPLHSTAIDPAYIGRAAVFLCADYFSHFTTGTVLKVDAGLSLMNYYALRGHMTPEPQPSKIRKLAGRWRRQVLGR